LKKKKKKNETFFFILKALGFLKLGLTICHSLMGT